MHIHRTCSHDAYAIMQSLTLLPKKMALSNKPAKLTFYLNYAKMPLNIIA